MGEVEKDSFIPLLGKGGHSGLVPSKTMCPNPGGFDEGSKVGFLAKLGCVLNLHFLKLISGVV